MPVKRDFKNNKPAIRHLILHHTAGNPMINRSRKKVIDSLSGIGFNRGYKKYGYDKKTGKTLNGIQCKLQNPIDYKVCFCEYHYAVQPYTLDNNIFGWRVVQLVLDPLSNDVGSTNNIKYNKYGVAVVFLGNYKDKMVDPKALQMLAIKMRYLLYYTNGKIEAIGHGTIDKTDCPGKIKEQIHAFKLMLKGGNK